MNNITAAVALPSQMNVVNVLVDLTIAHCIPYKAIDTIALEVRYLIDLR